MNFRDVFAVAIWGSVVGLFAAHSAGALRLPDQVVGFLITVGTLVVQFYFRKRPADESARGTGGA